MSFEIITEIDTAHSYCVGKYSMRLNVWIKFYKPKVIRTEMQIYNGIHFKKDGSFDITTEVFVPYREPNGVNSCQFVVMQDNEKGNYPLKKVECPACHHKFDVPKEDRIMALFFGYSLMRCPKCKRDLRVWFED